MISDSRLLLAIPALSELDPALRCDMERRAVAFIETVTARYFGEPEPIVEFVRGTGTDFLLLGEVALDTDSDDDITVVERCRPCSTAVALQSSAFEVRSVLRGSSLARLDGRCWKLGFEYEVGYQRGYETDHGPKDIEQLVIDLLSLRLNFIGKEGMRTETIGGYSYTRFGEGDLDSIDGADRILSAWKRTVFA